MLNNFKSSNDITLGIRESLSVFFSDESSNLIDVFTDSILEGEHVSLSHKEGNLFDYAHKNI